MYAEIFLSYKNNKLKANMKFQNEKKKPKTLNINQHVQYATTDIKISSLVNVNTLSHSLLLTRAADI